MKKKKKICCIIIFIRININSGKMEFNTDIFKLFPRDYGLLTVGNKDNYNAMTIGWGGLGTLWDKPVVTVYVKTSRYTHELLDNEDYFTLSFFDPWYQSNLKKLGSISGRDTDKMKECKFEIMERPHGIMYKVANVTFVCKKLLKQPLNMENIPKDIVQKYYTGDDDAPHDMYIGEVVEKLFHSKKGEKYNSEWIFKEGKGKASNSSHWRVCYDGNTKKYTAGVFFGGAGGSSYNLYEITKEIFDKVGTFEDDEYNSERLIATGRELYRGVNDRCGPPYTIEFDKACREICPWADIPEPEDDKIIEKNDK